MKKYYISPVPTKDPENNNYRVWEGIEKRYMGMIDQCRAWIDDIEDFKAKIKKIMKEKNTTV